MPKFEHLSKALRSCHWLTSRYIIIIRGSFCPLPGKEGLACREAQPYFLSVWNTQVYQPLLQIK